MPCLQNGIWHPRCAEDQHACGLPSPSTVYTRYKIDYTPKISDFTPRGVDKYESKFLSRMRRLICWGRRAIWKISSRSSRSWGTVYTFTSICCGENRRRNPKIPEQYPGGGETTRDCDEAAVCCCTEEFKNHIPPARDIRTIGAPMFLLWTLGELASVLLCIRADFILEY